MVDSSEVRGSRPSPSSTTKEILDGVAYGLLTAGVFGWLCRPDARPQFPNLIG